MKKYELLRLALKTRGFSLEALGDIVFDGTVKSVVSMRLSGRTPWRIEEAYKILDALRLPHSWLPLLFPPNGIADVTDEQRDMIRFGRVA